MLSRLDLPLRDVLLVAISGAHCTFVAAVVYWCLTGETPFTEQHKLFPFGLALGSGLFFYTLQIHRIIPPWRRPFLDGLETIRIQIKDITKDELVRDEKWGKPIYKLWLESICEESVRAHIHYTTGLYYMFAAVSFITFLGFLAIGVLLLSHIGMFIYYGCYILLISLTQLQNLIVALFAIAFSGTSYRMSTKLWHDVVNAGVIAMHSKKGEKELQDLAKYAGRVQEEDLAIVEEGVRLSIALFKPEAVGTISSVKHEVVEQYDLRDDAYHRICHITITTDDPVGLNGRRNLYNGPIQKEIAHETRMQMAGRVNVHNVRLQIVGENGLADLDVEPSSDKPVYRIKTDEAIGQNIIGGNGAVALCCKEYGIQQVLLRNGTVIGPSPGLAEVIKALLRTLPEGCKIYDPFAGTFMVERASKKILNQCEVVANDRLSETGEQTGYDAYEDSNDGPFHMVVVDPFYEDVIYYLKRVVTKLRYRYLVVQHGDDCDLVWNDAVEELLRNYGTRLTEYDGTNTYGKAISVVQSMNDPFPDA